jgi:hypothetical protein
MPTTPSSPRRVQELRERRQRLSEQRDYPSSSGLGGSGSSSSRSRVLAEYDTALAESQAKRQRQTEENRSNVSKSEEKDLTERRQEKYKTMSNDDNQKYESKFIYFSKTKKFCMHIQNQNNRTMIQVSVQQEIIVSIKIEMKMD